MLADHERFSSAGFALGAGPRTPDTESQTRTGSPSEEQVDRQSGAMLTTDPPEHSRLRRLVSGQFTVKRVRWLEPRTQEVVEECMQTMASVGPPVDLVPSFALPVPSRVICSLLGVPSQHAEEFQLRLNRQSAPDTPEAERQALDAETRSYLGELVRITRSQPGDDILGMLVRDHGEELSDIELVNIADLLLFAGHETTANMLSLSVAMLLGDPAQRDLLRDDPTVVPTAVEELLRYLAVLNQTIPRTATEDTTLRGHDISQGETVMVSLTAANRDPRILDRPDELDVTRSGVPHLAFGHGVHHCLGAALARAELAIALPALLNRFPDLRLVDDEIAYRPPGVFFGLERLAVTW